jgi:hypothetical protein
MNFRYVCKKAPRSLKLPSNKWPIHSFWRGLTALQWDMRLSDVWEKLAPRENASSQKKLLFKMPISRKLFILRVWKCVQIHDMFCQNKPIAVPMQIWQLHSKHAIILMLIGKHSSLKQLLFLFFRGNFLQRTSINGRVSSCAHHHNFVQFQSILIR